MAGLDHRVLSLSEQSAVSPPAWKECAPMVRQSGNLSVERIAPGVGVIRPILRMIAL